MRRDPRAVLLCAIVALALARGPRVVPTSTPQHSSAFSKRYDIVVFLALLLLLLSASLLLIPYNIEQTARLMALATGVSLGAAIFYCASSEDSILTFSDDVFFYALVPPVVFAEAFTMRKTKFFAHIGSVCTSCPFIPQRLEASGPKLLSRSGLQLLFGHSAGLSSAQQHASFAKLSPSANNQYRLRLARHDLNISHPILPR